MDKTEEEVKHLAEFALEILEDWPDIGTLDGFDLQDIAEKHKLLIPQTVYAPCGEDCNCTEFYGNEEFQKGATCYRIAEWLTRDAQQRNEADLPQQNLACIHPDKFRLPSGRLFCPKCQDYI